MKPATKKASRAGARSSTTFEDRRRNPRVELLSELYGCIVALDLPVLVRNASRGGFFVESPCPFPVGSEHTFRFQGSSGRSATIAAVCRHIQRVNGSTSSPQYAAGFEFLPLQNDNLRRVLTIMAAATVAEARFAVVG